MKRWNGGSQNRGQMDSSHTCAAPPLHGVVEDGILSLDRCHGDPFPLPKILKDTAMHDPDVLRDEALLGMRARLVNEAVKSVNVLASATMNSRKAMKFDRSPCPGRGPTLVQQAFLADMQARIDRVLEHEPDCTDDESLSSLLGTTNLYEQQANHLASFDVSKIKIFSRRLKPMDAADLCPSHVKQHLKHHHQFIEKTQEEIDHLAQEGDRVRPYWDPKLRDSREERIKLYQALDSSGLLCFRRKRNQSLPFSRSRKKTIANGSFWTAVRPMLVTEHLPQLVCQHLVALQNWIFRMTL